MKRSAVLLALFGVALYLAGCMGMSAQIRMAVPPMYDRAGPSERPTAWLGAVLMPVDAAVAEQLALPQPQGAAVVQVAIGSPAHAAGLAPGDVITSLDGKAVPGFLEVPDAVRASAPGRKLRVGLLRNGRAVELAVSLGAQPSERPVMWPGFVPVAGSGGLRIRDVEAVLLARANGLREGDTLKSIGGFPVATLLDFFRALYQVDSPPVVEVLREGRRAEAVIAAPYLSRPDVLQPWRGSPQPERERLPLVSILDLRTDAVTRDDMGIIVDVLGGALVRSGRFRVLERARRDALLQELGAGASDAFDPKYQQRAGRLLSADSVVIGSLARVESRYVISLKLVGVETGDARAAATGTYASLSALIDDSGNLAGQLAAPVR